MLELKRKADAVLAVDGRQALARARRARAAAERVKDPLAKTVGEHALAKAHHAGQRYRQALIHYRRSSRGYARLGRSREQARVELARVDALYHLGRYPDSERAARTARRMFLRSGDTLGAAKVLVNLASLRHAQDRHLEALALLGRARPAAVAQGDRSTVAAIDLNQANSLSLLGRFERAGLLYRAARRSYQGLAQPAMVALVDYNLAYDHFLQGRFHDARRLLVRAAEVFRKEGARHGLGLAMLDEAEMELVLNRPDRALAAAEDARGAFLAEGAPVLAARAALFAAEASGRLKDPASARRQLAAARAGFARAGHQVGQAAVALARAALALDPAPDRLSHALAAGRSFRRHGLLGRAAMAFAVAGEAALEARRPEAVRWLSLARALGQRSPLAVLRAEHALGRAAQGSGRGREALVHYRKAVDAYERLRGGIRSDDERLAFASGEARVFEDSIRAALDEGRIDEAFELVERARARALVDLLAADRRFVDAALRGSRLGRRLARLKRSLLVLEARARSSERRGAVLSPGLAGLMRRTLAEHEQAALLLEVEEPGRSYAVCGRPVVPLAELQAALGDRALIAYFGEGKAYSALVIRKERVDCVRALAGQEQVERLARAFGFAIAGARLASSAGSGVGSGATRREALLGVAEDALSRLHDALYQPLAMLVGDRDLVVVPHARLHLLPFHALMRRGEPLLLAREVSLAPSATVLTEVGRRRLRPGGGALVVSLADAMAPAIAAEAREVAALLGATRLSGGRATASALRRLAPGARVLHLAAHGAYESSEPALSGLRLSDGRLTLPEVAALGLDAALVTVSACESAVGRATGDEVLGLVRSFLQAGARSLVASLWAVPDASTAELMAGFYAALVKGKGVASALRQAALAVRRSHPHPYHWAPFVAVGAWGPVYSNPGPIPEGKPS